MKQFIVLKVLLILASCAHNDIQVNYSQNKEAWEAVKERQPPPTKKKEASLEELRIAYNDCLLPYALDKDVYNQLDYFAAPYEYNINGKGDCEDFAICVFYKAKQMGADATLVIGDNGHPTITHVITEVVIGDTLYIADNTKGRILKASQFYPMSFKPIQRLK